MLLYIHGFNSSPDSAKAQAVRDYVSRHYPNLVVEIPKLATSPNEAMTQLEAIVAKAKEQGQPLRFIGSSLGGYFSSYLAERHGGKAVLINPAVTPYDLLQDYIGPQTNPYSGEQFEVKAEHMQQLKDLDTPVIEHPDRFLVLLQSGDEVLDYRQAVEKYQCALMEIEAGGDHSFVNFERHLAAICRFLDLA